LRAHNEARPIASGPVFAGIGFAGGLLGGLLGVGGGFILVPLQVMVGGMPEHRAHATSLAAIVPGAVVAVLIYGFFTPRQVDWRLALLLVLGSVFGAYAGARVMTRIPERSLKAAFAVALALVAAKELISP
jgi:hypothetical protein